MENDVTAKDRTPEIPPSYPPARWNVIALPGPLAGLLAGCLAASSYGGHPVSNGILGLRVFGVVCFLGLLAGVIAAVRRERPWRVTALGLAINGMGALGLVAFTMPLWD